VLLAVLVAAVLVVVGWLFAFSSVLAARTVQVRGTQILAVDDVRAAAGVRLGTPLARQDLQAVADRVATLKPVSRVDVTRSWPDTVVIEVRERTPLLAVGQPDGFLLIDASGTGYQTVPAAPAGVLLTEADVTNGPLLSQLGSVAAAMPPDLRSKVKLAKAITADGIRLTLTDGDVVLWGSAEQSSLKAQVLTSLLKQRGTTYDVSAPHSPAVR
jgi:cell division protein FtsQ